MESLKLTLLLSLSKQSVEIFRLSDSFPTGHFPTTQCLYRSEYSTIWYLVRAFRLLFYPVNLNTDVYSFPGSISPFSLLALSSCYPKVKIGKTSRALRALLILTRLKGAHCHQLIVAGVVTSSSDYVRCERKSKNTSYVYSIEMFRQMEKWCWLNLPGI